MLARVLSATLRGIDAALVSVEVDVTSGLPSFATVGLPDSAVRESRDRVRAAVKNAGFEFPMERITVNLAPADLRKEGPAFDLPMALGLLGATGVIKPGALDRVLILGELALDGTLRPVRGTLPVALLCRRIRLPVLIVPAANAAEAAAVSDVTVIPLGSVQEAVEYLNGERLLAPARPALRDLDARATAASVDFADVRGQPFAKRALEIAAAGGHNVLRVGPTVIERYLSGKNTMDFQQIHPDDDLIHEQPE